MHDIRSATLLLTTFALSSITHLPSLSLQFSAKVDFFGQEAPVKDGKDGVMIVRYADGRASGDAMVLFENDRDMETALEKNKMFMGSRYVELFASSLKEFQMVGCFFRACDFWILRMRYGALREFQIKRKVVLVVVAVLCG